MSINSSKYYNVKVYTENDTYITTWDTDVVDGISFNNEINSAGGQMVLTLARNAGDYGEGSDVDFGHKVKVYCFDKEEPNGVCIFQGFITSYTPIYRDNKVNVTILGSGYELNDHLYSAEETLDNYEYHRSGYDKIAGTYQSPTLKTGPNVSYDFGVYIKTGAGITTIKTIEIALWWTTDYNTPFEYDVTVRLVKAKSGLEEDLPDYPYTEYGATTILAGTTPHYSSKLKDYVVNAVFETECTVSANTFYWVIFECPDAPTNGYNIDNFVFHLKRLNANDALNRASWQTGYYPQPIYQAAGSDWSSTSGYSGYPVIAYYSNDPSTTFAFSSVDPSVMLTDIIDRYQLQDGVISYDDTSITATGTTVSYTFNSNTSFEAIQQVLSLCPKDWYWYINYEDNTIHLKVKDTEPNHILSLEKDIIDAQFEKRIEGIVNVVYFSGGDIGGGVNLFKKYENTDSIIKYGIKAIKYSDQRVTVEATAETISNSILESRSEPELRVTLEILDSNTGNDTGYDLESLQVGDLIAVRNMTQQVGLSTWDISRWDESYWDFNIYNLSSLQMQIKKIEYKGDTAIIQASTIPPDVNKRIEDINRNLETLQTLNNPTAPT